jgi:hypothetical protein
VPGITSWSIPLQVTSSIEFFILQSIFWQITIQKSNDNE